MTHIVTYIIVVWWGLLVTSSAVRSSHEQLQWQILGICQAEWYECRIGPVDMIPSWLGRIPVVAFAEPSDLQHQGLQSSRLPCRALCQALVAQRDPLASGVVSLEIAY